MRYAIAAGLGLSLSGFLGAAEPARLDVNQSESTPAAPASNQDMAVTIAQQLQQSGQLRGFKIDVIYQDGTAEVVGHVMNQPQREEVLRIVQGVPGVEKVRDQLVVIYPGPVTQVQAALPQMAPMPRPADPNAPVTPNMPQVDPAAIYYAPPMSPYALNTPYMPPYAWPTYAPYNNYSRVAYPLEYPGNAWPFIGPFHPFPKVPLGWRRVELEWMDGHWWFGKTAQKHDWWRIRYW
jgi:hypothetical protein